MGVLRLNAVPSLPSTSSHACCYGGRIKEEKKKGMGISKRVAAGVMTGLLVAAAYAPARAQTSDDRATSAPRPSAAVFAGPYSPLTPEVVRGLPAFLKASDVAGMSPTVDDLRVQNQAEALLVEAAKHVQNEGQFKDSRAAAEYGAGINAYAQGRYIETVLQLRAAMVTERLIPVKE